MNLSRIIGHRFWATLVVLALVVTAVVVLRGEGQKPTPPGPPQPKVAWSEQQVRVSLAPGKWAIRRVTFTSSLALDNIAVDPVPEIARFLGPQPVTFSAVAANQAQRLKLFFRIPPDTAFGSYEGTVHVRLGSRTLPDTLKISLVVGADILPPDPGDAGKVTLEGIDSDGDGVRDDLQRYIEVTYPESQAVRNLLREYAITGNLSLLDASDRAASREDVAEAIRTQECLRQHLGENAARQALNQLRPRLLNTLERSRAYLKQNLGSYVISGEQIAHSTCDF